jgi:hypothetical protein
MAMLAETDVPASTSRLVAQLLSGVDLTPRPPMVAPPR